MVQAWRKVDFGTGTVTFLDDTQKAVSYTHLDVYKRQDHTFEVWQVEIDGQIHRFAAGEFSNCVWGFYLEKNG